MFFLFYSIRNRYQFRFSLDGVLVGTDTMSKRMWIGNASYRRMVNFIFEKSFAQSWNWNVFTMHSFTWLTDDFVVRIFNSFLRLHLKVNSQRAISFSLKFDNFNWIGNLRKVIFAIKKIFETNHVIFISFSPILLSSFTLFYKKMNNRWWTRDDFPIKYFLIFQ